MRRLLAVVAFCAICGDPHAVLALASSTPGIGFELTLNYGTAAVAYSNGTTIPIAKIEGGPAYKAEMRRLLQETLTPCKELGLFSSIILVVLSCLQFLKLVERQMGESPLTGMLSALKVSTEVFLEEEIQNVEIVLPMTRPYATKKDSQTEDLDAILSSIGLSRMNEQPTRSSIATCYANNITSTPSTFTANSPGFILAVDYSRSALLLSLENLEVGLLEITKTTARLDLGADSIRSFQSYWRAVEIEMKRIVNGVNVKDVAVSGDRVWEEVEVLNLVKRIVGKKVLQGRHLGVGGGGVDPLWAGVFGVARMAAGGGYEDGLSVFGVEV